MQLSLDLNELFYLLNDPWNFISAIGIMIFIIIMPILLKMFYETWSNHFIKPNKEQIDVPAKKSRSAKIIRSR